MANQISDIEAMLVVIYKKLDDIQHKLKGNFSSAPMSSYHEELKKEADEVKISLDRRKTQN